MHQKTWVFILELPFGSAAGLIGAVLSRVMLVACEVAVEYWLVWVVSYLQANLAPAGLQGCCGVLLRPGFSLFFYSLPRAGMMLVVCKVAAE